MSNLQIFENPEFGTIRTIIIDSEPWLVGKDIAAALGYGDTDQAIRKHVDDEDKLTRQINGIGQRRSVTVINESGVYSLVFGSKLESAKAFKHWVTSVVLPAIRKNGGYIANQENLSDEELMAKALMVAQRTIANKDKQIAEMKPKALFADAVSASKTSILIGDLAKILKQNGIETGQRRLFSWLRENGYLMKSGNSKNLPTQRAMELKLFEIKEGSYINSNGVNVTTKTTKVTGKGQIYFINKLLEVGSC